MKVYGVFIITLLITLNVGLALLIFWLPTLTPKPMPEMVKIQPAEDDYDVIVMTPTCGPGDSQPMMQGAVDAAKFAHEHMVPLSDAAAFSTEGVRVKVRFQRSLCVLDHPIIVTAPVTLDGGGVTLMYGPGNREAINIQTSPQ